MIKLMRVLAVAHAGSLSWLTGTLELNRAVVSVISNTCAFPANQRGRLILCVLQMQMQYFDILFNYLLLRNVSNVAYVDL